MMLFSELYGAYYGTVARVLRAAADHPLTQEEIQQIVAQYAFGDSVMSIPTALRTERWPLIRQDGTTPIQKPPTLPLTRLQKQWLNAVAQDPRISLFMDKPLIFSDEPPLFRQEDIAVYDQYADGDDYTSEAYKRNFRLILDAIRK